MIKKCQNEHYLGYFLHKLNPKYKLDVEIYDELRYSFISQNEGISSSAYDDATGKPINQENKNYVIKGNITIGIGFNMQNQQAKNIWNKAFGEKIDFQSAKKGAVKLNKEEINTLFNYVIKRNQQEIRNYYKKIFDKLPLNELLAIEDLYFNLPKLVNSESIFHKEMHDYHETQNIKHLDAAIYQVKSCSNLKKIRGLQTRRNKEAALLEASKILPHHFNQS